MDSEAAAIVRRIQTILANDADESPGVLGGYIVGATIARDDWEEIFQAQYPLLDEIAELGADLEITESPSDADQIMQRIRHVLEKFSDTI